MKLAELIRVAELMLEAGVGISTRRVLGEIRGRRAFELVQMSRQVRPKPRVFSLTVTGGTNGVALPLTLTPGTARFASEASAKAFRVADTLSRELLPRQCSLAPDACVGRVVDGGSLGLPAFLALVLRTAMVSLDRPLFATGSLDAAGNVGTVSGVSEKVALALEEIGDDDAWILVPPGSGLQVDDRRVQAVASTTEALSLLWPDEVLRVAPDLLYFAEILRRCESIDDHAEALALLQTVTASELSPADQARLAVEKSRRYRHLGQGADAQREEAIVERCLGVAGRVLGPEWREQAELDSWNRRIDEFDLQAVEEHFSEHPPEDLLREDNELRARGMLAQALAMQGRYEEAVALRSGNLALHDSDEWSRSRLPGTLCYLAMDSAAAGRSDDFHRFGAMLVAAAPDNDTHQARYNATALLRGLTFLGENQLALDWACDRQRPFGWRLPESVLAMAGSQRELVERHPEITILRSLIRAAWRQGDAALTETLATQIGPVEDTETPSLVAWLRLVASLELAVARHGQGELLKAGQLRDRVRSQLPRAHSAATRFHSSLTTTEWEALPAAIDRVWY